MNDQRFADAPRILVAGGGIAALEAVLALHSAAPRARLVLIAPDPVCVLRPFAVAEPFARGHADPIDLPTFMSEHGGTYLRAAIEEVAHDLGVVRCSGGSEHPFDGLIIAVGARERPAFDHATTFGTEGATFAGVVADLEEGYSRSAAFVVPPGPTWPLPMFELALQTAHQVRSMGLEGVELHVVTPEPAPLSAFGSPAGDAVLVALAEAAVVVHTGVRARVPRNGEVMLSDDAALHVDRIVALPVLEGPRIPGIPCDQMGFHPVDGFGAVPGADGVYVVGDAADHAVKFGALACEQADVAAAAIVARAGIGAAPEPWVAQLHGLLVTGTGEIVLEPATAAAHPATDDRTVRAASLKVRGAHLTGYLRERDAVHLRERGRTGPV